MGKYNDIWIRVKEYDKAEKERKRKQRADKRKQLEERRREMTVPIVEDVSLLKELSLAPLPRIELRTSP